MMGAYPPARSGASFGFDEDPRIGADAITMPQPDVQGSLVAIPRVKPSFFGQGGTGRGIAGALGDYMLQRAGMGAIYAPAMQQQRAMEAQRRQAFETRRMGLEDYDRRRADDLEQSERKRYDPQEIGGNLVRLKADGSGYETLYQSPPKPEVAPSVIRALQAAGIDPASEQGRDIVINNLVPPAFTEFGSDATGRTLYQTRGISQAGTPPIIPRVPDGAYSGPDPMAFAGGVVTSGRRTVEGNRAVGGAGNSNHLRGDAVDYTPRPGENLAQLRDRVRGYIGSTGKADIHNGNHVHADLPGYERVPYYGARGAAGAATGPRVVARTAPVANPERTANPSQQLGYARSRPVPVTTAAQATALPRGTFFRTPDGRTMQRN